MTDAETRQATAAIAAILATPGDRHAKASEILAVLGARGWRPIQRPDIPPWQPPSGPPLPPETVRRYAAAVRRALAQLQQEDTDG